MCVYSFIGLLWIFETLSAVITDETLRVERSEGFRIESVGHSGARWNFSWTRSNIANWLEANRHCTNNNGQLPRALEMRYFYKTIRSDDVTLPHRYNEVANHSGERGVVFYLGDVLEATMDYPNRESGERMCLVVEKQANNPVHLSEMTAVRSCTVPVNLLICRFPVDQGSPDGKPDYDVYGQNSLQPCDAYRDQWSGSLPQWIIDLKKKAETRKDHVCFRSDIFYAISITGCALLALTLVSTVVLACRYKRLQQHSRQGYAESCNNHQLVSPQLSRVQSGPQPVPTGKSDVGRMDLLADSTFYRSPTAGSARASYKQALTNDGYQRLAKGLQSSANSTAWTDAAHQSLR